jgi:hypothetical protein
MHGSNTKKNDMRCCGNKYFRLWCVYCVPRTLHGTQYTHHSLKYLLPQHRISYNDEFFWSNPQYCSFSMAEHKFPDDGPIVPKYVGANIEILTVHFNILCV